MKTCNELSWGEAAASHQHFSISIIINSVATPFANAFPTH
jgi:hypothetical protein